MIEKLTDEQKIMLAAGLHTAQILDDTMEAAGDDYIITQKWPGAGEFYLALLRQGSTDREVQHFLNGYIAGVRQEAKDMSEVLRKLPTDARILSLIKEIEK